MSQRWLLLLGSNRADPGQLHAGLAALAGLGRVRALGPPLRNPDRNGGPDYFNQLALLDCALDYERLKPRLADIERALGRGRGASGEVALDIDPVAISVNDRWQADARALAKGEFARPPLPELLDAAGIVVSIPPASG